MHAPSFDPPYQRLATPVQDQRLLFHMCHNRNFPSKKSHHWIAHEALFHRNLHNPLHFLFCNGTVMLSMGNDFWFLRFPWVQVRFLYIWKPKVSLMKKSRLHKIKISYLWRLDPSNFDRSFISTSNRCEKTPINILKSGFRSTMFRPVRFSLILGRSRILTYNSSRALSIDPLRSRVIFAKLGPIEFYLASGRVTFCVYNFQRSPQIELY